MPVAQELVLAQKFLSESLNKYETTIMDAVYPEYWGYEGKYHTAIGDLKFGAQGLVTARRDFTGRAVNYGGKATTIPLANFGMNMDTYKTVKGVLAADWTWEELQAEEMASQNPYLPRPNVVASYRESLERGLREWMHIRTVFGDPTIAFTGLITNPFVEVVDVTAANNGLTGTSPTAAAAYEFFRRELSDFKKSTRLTSESVACLTSEDVRSSLDRRFADNSNDGTPRRLLTNGNDGMLTAINAVNEMDGSVVRDPQLGNLSTIGGVTLPGTAGSATSAFDLMLFLETSASNQVERNFADIETMEPFRLDDGMTFRQIGVCATSEVVFKQPFRARLYVLRKV